jgi:hypothetical protein
LVKARTKLQIVSNDVSPVPWFKFIVGEDMFFFPYKHEQRPSGNLSTTS